MFRPAFCWTIVTWYCVSGLLPTPAVSQAVEGDDEEQLKAAAPAAALSDDVDPAKVVQRIVEMTNAFRDENEAPAVEKNEHLTAAAKYFADFMARTDRYGHQADGSRPSGRAKDHGYDYCLVAENIAYQYKSTGFDAEPLAEGLVKGWKDSPEHRENMLDPDVRDTGVAVAQSQTTGHWYAVQMFGRPKSAVIEFQVANESTADVSYTVGEKTYQLPARYTRTHMRCRPSTIQFDLKADGDSSEETVQASSGDRYLVEGEAGALRLKKE